MPTRSRPAGPLRAAVDDVNEAIRRLMRQPASRQRTEAYHQLLDEWGRLTRGASCRQAAWCEVARGDVEPAA